MDDVTIQMADALQVAKMHLNAQKMLIFAYRTGMSPSEKTFKEMERSGTAEPLVDLALEAYHAAKALKATDGR